MIGSHLSEASLNDYAEGRLTGAELARAERHLAECVQCRSAAKQLCGLIGRLRELPRELDPAIDLLPAIRAETKQRRAAHVRGRATLSRRVAQPRRRALRWPRAAAAAALIIAGGTLTVLAVRSASEGGAADRGAGPVDAPGGGVGPEQRVAVSADSEAPLDELRRLEAEYARATRELLAAFREERDRLGDGTVRVIDDNIRTVERALQQSQQALGTDPQSPVLRELVLTAYRQRLDIARRAAAVASGS